MKKLNRKMLASIGVVAVTLVLTSVLTSCGSGSDSSNNAQTFDVNQVEEMTIKTDGENITIRPSDNQEIKVSSNHKVEAALSGDVLTVQPDESSGIINFKKTTLYVDVPAKSFRKMTLQTSAGKISGENLQADELYLSADSGKIQLNGFEGSKLEGDMAAGNMDLKKVAGALNIKNDSGKVNIDYNGTMEKDSSIETNSGSVEFNFDARPSDLQLDVSSQSGNIESALTDPADVTSRAGEKVLNKKLGSNGGAAPTLTIRTSSGNVTLK